MLILVGVDDSPNAAAAAAFGRSLARRTGATCHLIHGAEPGLDPVAAGIRVREALGTVRPSLQAEEIEVCVGHSAEVLRTRAVQLGAQLIILGGKEHTLLGRWVAGSTAISLIRESPIPVLVTRGMIGTVGRVLAGVDATSAAYGVLRLAEEWATLFGAELRVVHAVPLPPLLSEYALGYDFDLLRASGDAVAAEAIWPLIGRASAERIVEVGEPASVLTEQARYWQADLLVIARHDRGWFQRAALGSVTERVLDGLPTSVLVVPSMMAVVTEQSVKGVGTGAIA